MKRHERCSISGRPALCGVASEIPLLSSFLYLLGEAGSESNPRVGAALVSGVKRRKPGLSGWARPVPRTEPGREFDWGGTSVKW